MTMFAGAFELPRLERVAVDTGPTVAASAIMAEVRDRPADRCPVAGGAVTTPTRIF